MSHSKDEVLRMANEMGGILRGLVKDHTVYAEDIEVLSKATAMLRAYAESADGWRPIETAPHDDYVIVHAPTGNPVTIKGVSEAIFSYEEDGRQWWRTRDGELVFDPQRWMPMPSPSPLTAALSTRGGT